MARFVVLNSKFTKKNVSYVKDGGELHQFLQTSGEDVGSPYSKFELEPAKSGGNGVNIRCCFSHKYWVRASNSDWIVASADVPDEDVTKRLCTLFEAEYVDVAKTTVKFLHCQTKRSICSWWSGDVRDGCLFAASKTADNVNKYYFEVIDWETLVIFPKHVTFKGVESGNYLGGCKYPQFESTDIGNERVRFEIFPTPNRSIRIKSNVNGKFWRCYPEVWADSTDTSTNNLNTLFLPIKVSDNVVALRNLGNNQFLSRKTDYLSACDATISQSARMEVEETVLSRKIFNVVYHLTDSTIYDENILTMANANATNSTTKSNTITITLKYTESSSRNWKTSLSLKLGVKASIKVGVPLITEKGIDISSESKGEYAWGGSQETKQELETEYTATVPPMSTVKVRLVATRGTCDVPFSYSQSDTLTTGEQIIIDKDDGVYTGINCFNFQYETKEEKLLSTAYVPETKEEKLLSTAYVPQPTVLGRMHDNYLIYGVVIIFSFLVFTFLSS